MIRAVLFDLYGTLIDIETIENDSRVYDEIAKFLSYRGIYVSSAWLQDTFKKEVSKAIDESSEKYPEPNIRGIWYNILRRLENPEHYKINFEKCSFVKDITVLHRSLSRKRFRLVDNALETISKIRKNYKLGIVTDCQKEYAKPEIKCLGLKPYFDAIVISGDFGYRKPDIRLFNACLSRLGVSADESVFVGNDVFRDMLGASLAGLNCVLIKSSCINGEILNEKEIDLIEIDRLSELPDVLTSIEKLGSTKFSKEQLPSHNKKKENEKILENTSLERNKLDEKKNRTSSFDTNMFKDLATPDYAENKKKEENRKGGSK
ncbi:MAG: HAD family hydrolase [Thermoplasmata archaeon]